MSAWKLDSVDFVTFGVYVSKSSGVLDLPKLINTGTDWTDENGKDYWNAPEDLKYSDRDIVLSCWIKGTSFADFKSKVAAFYSALMAVGTRTLTTPYNEIANITIENGIQLVRETAYISSINIGSFNLRLNVAGDTQTKLITIYNGGDDTVRGVYPIRNDAKLSRRLQGDDTITFDIEFNTKNTIGRDDYTIYGTTRYIAFEYPEIKKLGTNKYIYSCQFQHEFFRLKDIQYRKLDQAEFYWWANADEIMDTMILNLDRIFPGKFARGTVQSVIRKNWQFTNESCLDVLTRLATDYELEYGYEKNIDGKVYISVKEMIGNATAIELSYGKGNGMYQITRTSTARDLMVTHLYAYGSDKNLPSGYRSGMTRLAFTGEPLLKPFYGSKREVTKIFDDIYPELKETVTSYTFTPSPDPINRPEEATYKMVANGMPYDLKELELDGITTKYLFSGTTAKIHFNTGSCAGFEFEVRDYQHTTKTFWLTPIKEANDTTYPSATIFPEAGDEFVILDIKLPQTKIDLAELALKARAQEYIDLYYQPHTNYSIVVEPGFALDVSPGDTVHVIDPDFANEILRVSDVQKNLYSGAYTLTLSDIIRLNNRQMLEKRVKQIEKVIENIPVSDVPDQIRSDKTVGELGNKIIDPIDEKFKADELVRDESLDPRMLAYDSMEPGFSITGLLVDVDYLGDPLKVQVSSGEIKIHNWRELTLDRKKVIEYEEENGFGTYVPVRTWTYAGGVINLATTAGYFLYAKIPADPNITTFTLECLSQHIRTKRNFPYYIYYKLGYINASASPRHAGMLWGNVRSFSEAPIDGKIYGRKDRAWTEVISPSDSIELTGDATGTGATGTPFATTLATVNPNVGTFGSTTKIPVVTVDGKGRVTAANEVDAPTGGGGSDVVSGDGMDFVTNDPVTLGLPSTISSDTINEVTATSHTHELGTIRVEDMVEGNPVEYGALYNWWAATDARGIANTGLHLPSLAEYTALVDELGGYLVAGGKLKETGLAYWDSPNEGATNEVGFNGRGSGFRAEYAYPGMFESLNLRLYVWASDIYNSTNGRRVSLGFYHVEEVDIGNPNDKKGGLAIRLVRAATASELLLPNGLIEATYIGNDNKIYPLTKIGSLVILAANLAETKYANGDWITGFDGGVYTPISNAAWEALTTEAMCYWGDNVANGGGETPLSTLLHPPVTIDPASASIASIGEDQVLTFTGASGTFTTADSKTVTVVNGLITSIV